MDEKLNVLLLGNSGAGKSTLIEAIAGVNKNVRAGEGDTSKIEVSESSVWPFVFIDTKGFEYNWFEQQRTIHQVKQYTKKQVAAAKQGNETSGIDVVWYCVEGTSKRAFSDNIKMMNMAIKGWKNVPVFAVITKSFSQLEDQENIEAVTRAFAKNKGVNLQKIIPVVAKAYKINDEVIVEPKGISELCNATIDCIAYAKKISKDNRDRMVLEQKRFTANTTVAGFTASAIVVGAVPISIADSLILVPLETAMAKTIFKIYGNSFSQETITAIVSSALITNIAKALLAKLKAIPELVTKIAASVLNAVVAGVFVAALGESLIALSEAIYKGIIDSTKLDEMIDFTSGKLKDNPLIGSLIKSIEENKDKLINKTPEEITKTVFDDVKKK